MFICSILLLVVSAHSATLRYSPSSSDETPQVASVIFFLFLFFFIFFLYSRFLFLSCMFPCVGLSARRVERVHRIWFGAIGLNFTIFIIFIFILFFGAGRARRRIGTSLTSMSYMMFVLDGRRARCFISMTDSISAWSVRRPYPPTLVRRDRSWDLIHRFNFGVIGLLINSTDSISAWSVFMILSDADIWI